MLFPAHLFPMTALKLHACAQSRLGVVTIQPSHQGAKHAYAGAVRSAVVRRPVLFHHNAQYVCLHQAQLGGRPHRARCRTERHDRAVAAIAGLVVRRHAVTHEPSFHGQLRAAGQFDDSDILESQGFGKDGRPGGNTSPGLPGRLEGLHMPLARQIEQAAQPDPGSPAHRERQSVVVAHAVPVLQCLGQRAQEVGRVGACGLERLCVALPRSQRPSRLTALCKPAPHAWTMALRPRVRAQVAMGAKPENSRQHRA